MSDHVFLAPGGTVTRLTPRTITVAYEEGQHTFPRHSVDAWNGLIVGMATDRLVIESEVCDAYQLPYAKKK